MIRIESPPLLPTGHETETLAVADAMSSPPCNPMPHLVSAVGLSNVKGTGSLVCKGVAQT